MRSALTFGDRAFRFYTSLTFGVSLPQGITVMNPYREPRVKGYVRSFLDKFYSDNRERTLVFGINPGRFGSGITGVTFTDPVALENYCAIPNDLQKKRELSSVFIYDFAMRWGSPQKLYRSFYFSAVSPLGFLRSGKNFNFYDDVRLLRDIRSFLISSIKAHIAFGSSPKAAIVLGTGKIREVFEGLNREGNFFKTVYALEHPRFIMQYRRKALREYLYKYCDVFMQALSSQ